MDSYEREELHEALDGEKNRCVRDRAWLACLVPGMEMPCKASAGILRKRARWVRKWLARYAKGGLAALPDLPRSGRPRVVGAWQLRKAMVKVSKSLAMPDMARSMIADTLGVVHRHSTVRGLMRAFGLSPRWRA